MRLFRSLVLVVLLLLWAAPASGAEELVMRCPVCDHVDAQAPAHCRRDASLPYTGASSGRWAGVVAGLLGAGALLLLVTRRRPLAAAGGPRAGR